MAPSDWPVPANHMSDPGWLQLTSPVPDASDCSASNPSAIRPVAATAAPVPPGTLKRLDHAGRGDGRFRRLRACARRTWTACAGRGGGCPSGKPRPSARPCRSPYRRWRQARRRPRGTSRRRPAWRPARGCRVPAVVRGGSAIIVIRPAAVPAAGGGQDLVTDADRRALAALDGDPGRTRLGHPGDQEHGEEREQLPPPAGRGGASGLTVPAGALARSAPAARPAVLGRAVRVPLRPGRRRGDRPGTRPGAWLGRAAVPGGAGRGRRRPPSAGHSPDSHGGSATGSPPGGATGWAPPSA